MKIAIPTYNRPELKSLELAESIVGKENVYVFFHNEEDRAKYTKPITNAVITNKPKGIGRQRNAILDYFEDGEWIIMMDDDLSEIYKLKMGKLAALTPEEARAEFQKNIDICDQNNCYLWGVYPCANAFFMNNRITNKAFIIGWIMGVKINMLRFDETFPTKEDFDYALQNMLTYKKVARFDYLTCNAKFKAKGGLDYVYGSEKEQIACEMLLHKWGNWVRPNPKRVNEVLLSI